MTDTDTETASKHVVPVIERMLDMLDLLQRRHDGMSIRQLCTDLDMPRSTVYRILNTLEDRDVVRRTEAGHYALGPRLLTLASNVHSGTTARLAEIAKVQLDGLSRRTKEASKLSVREGDSVVVIAVALGFGEYALSLKPGRRVALHAGAASKILFAHMQPRDFERVLASPLPRFTDATLIEPAALRAEMRVVRKQGWAVDKAEFSNGVYAVAAPVTDRQGNVVAALSVPFLATPDTRKIETLRAAVVDGARLISAEFSRARP